MFSAASAARQVIVVDPCALTGLALCVLASQVLPGVDCLYLPRLSDLHGTVRDHAYHRTLVVTELFSATEGLSDGLATLARLVAYRQAGLKVKVFTAVTDPLLLRLVLALRPTAVMLRSESLRQVRVILSSPGMVFPRTRISPGVKAQLGRAAPERLTRRQAEWWLTQADGLGLQASADRLRVTYKTAASLRHHVIQRLGGSATAFDRRMAALRGQTGFCRARPPSTDSAEA